MTDYIYPPYVQTDGTIMRHYVCQTTAERDALSPPAGCTIFVKDDDAYYVRLTDNSWASASAAPHNHDSDYSDTAHTHEGGGGEAFPVGAVFIAVVSTDPATLLGYGTWSAIAAGRMLVGLNSGDADFDTAEETGGAKTVTLTTAEMPAHTHVETNNSANTGGTVGFAARDTSTNTQTATGYSTESTGGGGAHNNMPPYFVVYIWKRTA